MSTEIENQKQLQYNDKYLTLQSSTYYTTDFILKLRVLKTKTEIIKATKDFDSQFKIFFQNIYNQKFNRYYLKTTDINELQDIINLFYEDNNLVGEFQKNSQQNANFNSTLKNRDKNFIYKGLAIIEINLSGKIYSIIPSAKLYKELCYKNKDINIGNHQLRDAIQADNIQEALNKYYFQSKIFTNSLYSKLYNNKKKAKLAIFDILENTEQ